MSIAAFLSEIEARLKAGKATEHTYRSALEALFNTVLTLARATNEPKQASYGAPDFIIQQGNAPIGHAEAKDVGLDLGKFIADSERVIPSGHRVTPPDRESRRPPVWGRNRRTPGLRGRGPGYPGNQQAV